MLLKIPLNEVRQTNDLSKLVEEYLKAAPLRWGGIGFSEENILIEAIPSPWQLPGLNPVEGYFSEASLGAYIVPTGLGCSIGGFGGDANLCAKLLSTEFDHLLVNPNVTNGGAWQNLSHNALYVEGFALDLFMKGLLGLRPVKANKLGLLFDKAISAKALAKELQTVQAAQTIWGLDFVGYRRTAEAMQLKITLQENRSSGEIANPQVLLESARELQKLGAEAIALVLDFSQFEEVADAQYLKGAAADPIGGLEAVCSHLISSQLLLPCAHAPSFASNENHDCTEPIDARVSPEIASYSFLPSVIKGLMRAPKLVKAEDLRLGDLSLKNLKAFIGPSDCWAGNSLWMKEKPNDLKAYAVGSNFSGLGLTPELLELEVCRVSNHFELLGRLRAEKLGLKLANF